MKNNLFIKLLTSIPLILLTLYFLPIIGICLIVLRYIINPNKSNLVPIILIIIGFIILLPKGLEYVFNLLNYNSHYIEDINNISIYSNDVLSYGKLLVILGIILLIIMAILNIIFENLRKNIVNYIQKSEQEDYKIRKENNLIMQKQREQVKNTHLVKCPNCGADNMLTSLKGVCSYCRKYIEYKN